MGHYSALVIRHDNDPSCVAEVLSALEDLDLVAGVESESEGPGALRVQVELPERVFKEIDATEEHLHRLARRFGLHLKLVLAVSTTDSFLYLHWYSGKIVRALGCGIEQDAMWTRASGQPEEWEAEAFEGEEVTSSHTGKTRQLGRTADGRIEGPRKGDLSLPADAMKYAECALASS